MIQESIKFPMELGKFGFLIEISKERLLRLGIDYNLSI